MTMNDYDTIPCEITLDETVMGRIPNAIRDHVREGGRLYLVERPENGHAAVSIDPVPTCKPCTYVRESHITVVRPEGDLTLKLYEVTYNTWNMTLSGVNSRRMLSVGKNPEDAIRRVKERTEKDAMDHRASEIAEVMGCKILVGAPAE